MSLWDEVLDKAGDTATKLADNKLASIIRANDDSPKPNTGYVPVGGGRIMESGNFAPNLDNNFIVGGMAVPKVLAIGGGAVVGLGLLIWALK